MKDFEKGSDSLEAYGKKTLSVNVSAGVVFCDGMWKEKTGRE